MKTTRRVLGDEKGFTMFAVFLIFILLATMASSALILSNIDLRSAAHYKTGRQAFYAAESGILHALGVINGRGVLDFQADIATPEKWNRLFGMGVKPLPSDGTSSYSVIVAADPADPANEGSITATGFAPLEAMRVLRVGVRKGLPADQGALYLANDDVDADFGGRNQFEIDGNDHTVTGALNPDGSPRPGISTRNDDVTQAVKDALSDPQKQQIRGLGFSLDPLDPSVMTTEGPTVTDLEQIVQYLLANNPVVEINDSVLPSGTYGTPEAPQVTHLTADRVCLNGLMTGVGILIADGELTINGSANFIGWMIVRGPTIVTGGGGRGGSDDTLVDGNATILGSLWSGDLVVRVGGSAIVNYCAECMELANNAGDGNNTPRSMSVVFWQEVL